MKSYDVFLDSFVNVLMPDDMEPGSPEFIDLIYDKAIEKYREKIREPGELTFTWERYEENDTDHEGGAA